MMSACSMRLRPLMMATALALLAPALARAQSVVQTFFIPFDEEEVHLVLNTIDNFGGNIGSEVRSTISVVAGTTNTILFWDHWEDGYEASLTSPTQASTRIWGDNNPANGIPPSFTNDRVGEGDIITLVNDITVPRLATNIYYDGRDKVSVTRWVAISRYMFAPDPGEVLADCAQTYDRGKYGFTFRAPVGINTGTNQMFEYSSILVSAGYNDTVVRVDLNADGTVDETVFLDEGETRAFRYTSAGASVEATKPVQCYMVTGDIGSNYEMRWFEMFPDNQWDTNYYTSACTIGGIPTEVYLFNPGSNHLAITCASRYGNQIVTALANSVVSYLMPTNTGANFFSTNGQPFIAVSAADARQAISGNQAYDWGHALVPAKALTSVCMVPWAPGSGGDPITVNGSPVWVTPETNTTLYVDLDGDSSTGPLVDPYGRRYNYSTNIVRLQSLRIFDTTDNDQTGMRLYTLNGVRFVAVWGEDPSIAPSGNPYLDMGAAIFPFPAVPAVKEWTLSNDLNTNGVVNPGDDVTFQIYVVNISFADADNTIVFDSGASNSTYKLGSTFVNGTNILDDAVPPAASPFPLDENGYNLGTLSVGRTGVVTYTVTVDDPFPTNVAGLINGVYVDNQTQVFVPVPIPGFTLTKTSTPTNPANPNDIINYTVTLVSTANTYQSGIQVTDPLPDGLTWVTNSTLVAVPGQFNASFIDQFVLNDEYYGDDGAMPWSSDWLESGESDGPGLGDIQVLADSGGFGDVYMLQVQNANRGAYRRVNLSRYTNAILRFDYRRDSLDSGSESVLVQGSSNAGTNWTTLLTLSGAATDAGYRSTNVSLNSYLATNAAIRFIANGSLDTTDRIFFDNVEIEVGARGITNSGFAPPTLIRGYGIASGETIRITFQARINGNISVSSVVNRVSAQSFQSPAPREASVTNIVLLPNRSRIAGQVRDDLDGDGNLNDSDPGLANVTLSLFSDPNGDRSPADGIVLATTTSDTNGYYELGYFLSNNYVIIETDPFNYRSTADSDGGNANLIGFTTANGINFTNNIFLDSRLATITGQVRVDADGDGDLTDSDSGLPGVLLSLYTDPNGDGDPADGVVVSTRVSSATGTYAFTNVTTGTYVLVETDPAGFSSTADSQPPNDNRVSFFMPGGIDFGPYDYLDANSGLVITKASYPPGVWYPDLLARYTITVVNTGSMTHTGLEIGDYLSDGLVYVPTSAYITAYFSQSNLVRDTFTTAAFTNNDGTTNWLGNWVETDAGGAGAGSGAIRVTGGQLRLTDAITPDPNIYRQVNLTNATSATLSFTYSTSAGVDSSDQMTLDVSTNNSTWITLSNYLGAVSGSASYDLMPYLSSGTYIRFRPTAGYAGTDEYLYIDNIQVSWMANALQTLPGAPPVYMLTNYTLLPGQTITVVFTAAVEAVQGVTNTACVSSDQLENELCATVINSADPAANPDRISGQVRFDGDGDGNLADAESGLQGVSLAVYSDPNGDGNPADGVVLDTTTTDPFGYYLFGNLASGRYVVVQTDLTGFTSTADSQGANDNRIAVYLTGGLDSRDNDFLDWSISGLVIQKRTTAAEIVVPGERIAYSIMVSNPRPIVASSVLLSDYLPTGIVYVAGSAWTVVSSLTSSNTVADMVGASTWTNSDGTRSWLTDWSETGDDNNVNGGDVRVTNDVGTLRIVVRDDNNQLTRSANLTPATEAILSYQYRRLGLEAGEYVVTEVATNSAGPWTEVARHANDGGFSTTDGSFQTTNINISAFISTNTFLRFASPAGTMSDSDQVYFDSIQIRFGSSGSLATNTPPPVFVSELNLSPGAYISVTFTADVTLASWIVNTARVTTAADPGGLISVVSNWVGDIAMTQGLVVVKSGTQAFHLAWSAYTNEQGEVSKDYDVIYTDVQDPGFHLGLTSSWAWCGTMRDSVFVDTGSATRLPPAQMGNRMRFYRATFNNTWQTSQASRFATKEIYVAKCTALKEGENFMSLFMQPDVNQLAFVFGTNRLPAGESMDESTRIEWYNSTAQSEATNIVWLSDAGVWLYAQGGVANAMPLPLSQGFNLILPPGSGDRDLLLIGRVPTNTSAALGHAPLIQANESYSIVSYNLPYRVRLKDCGLKAAGFQGVSAGQPFNPRYSDEIRIMQKGGGSFASPTYRILLNSSGQFQYYSGGTGSADNHPIEPDDALVIYTKKSKTNFTWNISLPYPVPTKNMAP